MEFTAALTARMTSRMPEEQRWFRGSVRRIYAEPIVEAVEEAMETALVRAYVQTAPETREHQGKPLVRLSPWAYVVLYRGAMLCPEAVYADPELQDTFDALVAQHGWGSKEVRAWADGARWSLMHWQPTSNLPITGFKVYFAPEGARTTDPGA